MPRAAQEAGVACAGTWRCGRSSDQRGWLVHTAPKLRSLAHACGRGGVCAPRRSASASSPASSARSWLSTRGSCCRMKPDTFSPAQTQVCSEIRLLLCQHPVAHRVRAHVMMWALAWTSACLICNCEEEPQEYLLRLLCWLEHLQGPRNLFKSTRRLCTKSELSPSAHQRGHGRQKRQTGSAPRDPGSPPRPGTRPGWPCAAGARPRARHALRLQRGSARCRHCPAHSGSWSLQHTGESGACSQLSSSTRRPLSRPKAVSRRTCCLWQPCLTATGKAARHLARR